MDLGLRGKRAAVAAASAGLGLAVAKSLAAEGARVVICGRDESTLRNAAQSFGGIPLVADLGDPAQARSFVERAMAEMGGLDVLVLNSGGPPPVDFAASRFEDYEVALQGNLLSGVAMCKAAVPAMQQQGWGRVLAITSLSARRPRAKNMMTGMARAGLTAFLKALSLDVAPFGVTVNTIQPGPHQTARLGELYGDRLDEIQAGIPTKTFGRPEDFGQVACFLCSDQARFITGSSVLVDGGSYGGLY